MTIPFYKSPLLTLDTETTGIDPLTDRVVTCNITYDYVDGTPPKVYDWLINPGVEIPQGASDVHGITNEIAKEYGQDPKIALENIKDHLEIWNDAKLPIVIYNARFDCSILLSEFSRYNIHYSHDFPCIIDPLVLDKALDKYRKGKRTLTASSEVYGVELDNAHSADADSMASVKIARAIGEKFHIDAPWDEVHNQQRIWAEEQAASLQEYFRKSKDPNAIVRGDWPYLEESGELPF